MHSIPELAYNGGMHRRFALLYSIFSVLVLLVLVILVVVRVNTIREFNIQEVQTSFIRLQGRVRTALSADEEADPGVVIREYAAQVPTARAIVLYDPAEGLRYVWTSNVETLGFAGTDLTEFTGFPVYNYSEISAFKVSSPLGTDDAPQIYIDGIYTVLTYADAYAPLRDSLIALLAFAFLTVLVAIAINASRRPRAVREQSDESAPVEPEYAATRPPAAEPAPAMPELEEVPTTTNLLAEADDADLSMPDSFLEEVDLEEIATDPGEPGTLFDPTTGLSFRQHLERRLGLELERSAFNDQDLTCMLVRFEDAADGGEAYNSRARQILAAFKFEDLCFEFGKGSFCVILPNTELSHAIREAEAFKGDHPGKMYFGMSARNGRLVESSRVLGEAERSLEHAEKEPGGIVGFRPDPRKYRQFVTQHLGPTD